MDGDLRMGMRVEGTDGPAGVVEDLLRDADGALRYLVVRGQGFFGSDVLLPAASATVSGDRVRVALSKDQIAGAERFDPARHGRGAGLVSAAADRYDQQDEDR